MSRIDQVNVLNVKVFPSYIFDSTFSLTFNSTSTTMATDRFILCLPNKCAVIENVQAAQNSVSFYDIASMFNRVAICGKRLYLEQIPRMCLENEVLKGKCDEIVSLNSPVHQIASEFKGFSSNKKVVSSETTKLTLSDPNINLIKLRDGSCVITKTSIVVLNLLRAVVFSSIYYHWLKRISINVSTPCAAKCDLPAIRDSIKRSYILILSILGYMAWRTFDIYFVQQKSSRPPVQQLVYNFPAEYVIFATTTFVLYVSCLIILTENTFIGKKYTRRATSTPLIYFIVFMATDFSFIYSVNTEIVFSNVDPTIIELFQVAFFVWIVYRSFGFIGIHYIYYRYHNRIPLLMLAISSTYVAATSWATPVINSPHSRLEYYTLPTVTLFVGSFACMLWT